MSLLIQYLVKLSISLALVWIFYQLFLRKLTFYNSNRWYLLGYTLLSFFIPFINISSVLDFNQSDKGIVQFIPVVYHYMGTLNEATNCPEPLWSTNYTKWDWMSFALATGIIALLLRFIIRFISFLRMQRKAKLISDDGVKLYQVDERIIPFSFGNAVFINSNLHSESELQEIIRHEFVHVKQKHTVDIVWAEILCMINWYNPFAWLLKMSIRQNLEFIADNKVLQNGFDKKQYQYLLLKVIGNNHFSIANQFNFSSLKKRIAMMNKIKSARVHLLRFLFILPLLAVILISFRQSQHDNRKEGQFTVLLPATNDTIPEVTKVNEKGYVINIKDNKGNCTVVVKDKNGKEVTRLPLTKWNSNESYYENLYGEIPPPPPPAPPIPRGDVPPPPPPPPSPAESIKMQNTFSKLEVNKNKVTIELKNGTIEKYDLDKPDEKAAFEKKYGEIAPPPPPPPAPVKPAKEVSINSINKISVNSNVAPVITYVETPVKIVNSLSLAPIKIQSNPTISVKPAVAIEKPVAGLTSLNTTTLKVEPINTVILSPVIKIERSDSLNNNENRNQNIIVK